MAAKSTVPDGVSSSGSVMYSGAIAAIIGDARAGRGNRHQAGARSQRAEAARCAAPVLPGRAGDDRAHGRNRPYVSPARAARSRASARASAARGAAPRARRRPRTGMPMSAITMSPACASAGGRDQRHLRRAERDGHRRFDRRSLDRLACRPTARTANRSRRRGCRAVDVGDDRFEDAGQRRESRCRTSRRR